MKSFLLCLYTHDRYFHIGNALGHRCFDFHNQESEIKPFKLANQNYLYIAQIAPNIQKELLSVTSLKNNK